ncbi:MAG: galactose oxidase [Planctomycetes bacterium]|nr:galactose oxidase [Planctomycetota bacterium]
MRIHPLLGAATLACALFASSPTALAHFLWLRVDPAPTPGKSTIRVFLAEQPEPDLDVSLEHVEGVRVAVGGHELALTEGMDSFDAWWAGALPAAIDARRDMGVRTRNGASHRLLYTARTQAGAQSWTPCSEAGLHARYVERDGSSFVEILFDGKPAPNARIKVYPRGAEPYETRSDERGCATIDGIADGSTGLWATWIDATPGSVGEQTYSESRHYASLTICGSQPTASHPQLPDPAVTSFGGAVLGDWMYVYSGHVGRMHRYDVDTTSKHFRRLNLNDMTTWEDLPMARDLQGVALVSDGEHLYRTGGMSAVNPRGERQDLRSVAEFARFDPASRTWTDLAPMPGPRSTHDAIVVGRTLYVVGGWVLAGSDDDAEYCDTAFAFDLDAPERGWRTFAQPFQRRALALAAFDGKVFALGGLDSDETVVRRVDVFDPATQAWSLAPELPGLDRVEGFAPSACSTADALYYSGMSGFLFRLDPGASKWSVVGGLHEPRLSHRLLAARETLLAVGGNAKGELPTRIEVLPIGK